MGEAFAQFGNIRWTAGWDMTVSGGKSPSVCTIRSVPHVQRLTKYSDLTLGEVGAGSLVLRQCVLETPQLNEDQTWSLPILDRRWKWRFGEIDGHYNIKRPDKTFIRERTPQELAELCLQAMGERRWDIGRLPNFARPEVEWDNDNPADSLDDLVSMLGCVWTLDYFKDCVVVWPIGEGINLPNLPTISRSEGLAAGAVPDKIKSLSAHIMYQVRFATEAVGMDVDGKIKTLDKLSYRPLDDNDPEEFENTGIAANGDDRTFVENGVTKTIRDLAKEWCYRTYRITGIVKSGQPIAHSTATSIAKLPVDGWSPEDLKGNPSEPKSFLDLALLSHRAEQYIWEDRDPNSDGHFVEVDKEVIAWVRHYSDERDAVRQDPWIYEGNVSVDAKLGLVRMSDPLYLNAKVAVPYRATVVPAEVFVDIAFHAGRDGHFVRKVVSHDTGIVNNTGARILKQEDVEVRVVQYYNFSRVGTETYSVNLSGVNTKPTDWKDQLQYYIDATLSEYAEQPSYTRHYYHLVALVPDGRIRQVSWSGGGGRPPTTRVSLASEHDNWTPTVEDDKRRSAADRLALDKQNQRIRLRRSFK